MSRTTTAAFAAPFIVAGLIVASCIAIVAATTTPANGLARLQTLEDCAVACDPLGPELVEGACYCRVDLVKP